MTSLPRRLSRHGLALAFAFLVVAVVPSAASAAPCDPPVTNPIACENTLPGADPSTWQIDYEGDETIQGFPTQQSVNKGETISFKIKSATSNYRINILRLGYYAGKGARLVASNLTPTSTAAQPACQESAGTGLIDCGNWSVSRSWTVPSNAVSGVYIAYLERNDTGGASHIAFVVRNDASTSDLLVQTSDATWQAYNNYGGNSLYRCTTNSCSPNGPFGYQPAQKVSYNRPMLTAASSPPSWLMSAEYPMIRFLERLGYNTSYTSQVDTETRAALIRNHKAFISSGHDEYWSKTQRDNVTAARDAGVNLAFFSGNEIFWKTRYESSVAGPSTANRTLVSYKDTKFNAATDPVAWTGTWRDPRFAPLGDFEPENSLTGQSFIVNVGTSTITVPAQYKSLRLWRNTAVASLSTGQSLPLGQDTLGYEWDEDPDNGYRPAGQFRASSTTVSGLQTFIDYGTTTTETGTATHNLTSYRAASGALVFGAGTVQWSWGLDDANPLGVAPDRNMQQATVNLFADMSAQPANLIPNVVGATKSTDTTKPTSTITSPPTTVTDGSVVTINGTASDTGGVVAGVEISTDNGGTWHPATTGTSNWSYSWRAHGAPSTVIKTRAVDDTGNLQIPGAGTTVNVTCPCSIWGSTFPVPAADADSNDPNSIEVGMKFKSDSYGTINGLRFYKAAANTGTHTGSLWSADGTRLALATFSGESASGWQTVTFTSPVEVQPNTTYVASYFAPNGRYSASAEYMYRNPAPSPQGGGTHDSPPLHVIRDSGTARNGLYTYSGSSTFPTNSFKAGNYWVDVLFAPVPPPGTVTNVTATAGGTTSANVSWTAPATGGNPTSYIVTPYIGATAQTPKTVNGSPPLTSTTVTGLTNGTTYTFRVAATNPNGNGAQSAASNAVTPLNAVAPSVPTGVIARPATSSANVTWTASASDGDSPITSYAVTPFIGASAQTPVSVSGSATSATVTGLTNGTTYTFSVKANNAVGASPASTPSGAVTPQSTVFDFSTPATVDANDPGSIELGMKFTADIAGKVTGVRFYKAAANVGTHTGSVWSTTGTRLATATFTNETASGWQVATFATPVDVFAGQTYIVSYFAPLGRYSASQFPDAGVQNGILRSVPNATSANGVYAYGTSSQFPANSYNASNYWVDVMFALPVPGTPTGISATAAGTNSATVSWSAPASGGAPSSYVLKAYSGATVAATKTVTGTPLATSATIGGLTSGTSYTFKVTARNMNGDGPESAASNAVTPLNPVPPTPPTNVFAQPITSSARVSWTVPSGNGDSPITGYTITPYIGATAQTPVSAGAAATATIVTGLSNGTAYTFKVKATNAIGGSADSAASNSATPGFTVFELATPGNPDSGDPNAVNVGMKFTADNNGQIRGMRFYKSDLNTGTHVGSLWTAAGALMTSATFTGESASGWQTVTFATPQNVTAGTTYVASYLAPSGHYAVTSNGFSSAIENPPLRGVAGPNNGVYAYGASSVFPNNSFNSANYWVDVLFTHAPPPAAPTNVTATAGQASATVSWTAPTGAPISYTVTTRVNGTPTGTPKTVSAPATSTTVSGLTPGTAYTFTVTAANAGGDGPASAASNAVTPTGASAPGAPTGVAAQGDSKSAVVRWTAPSSDGGSAITGFTVTPFVGTTAGTTQAAAASATSARVTGLSNGTSYTFRVNATNGVGTGPDSAASGSIVPRDSIFDLVTPPTVDGADPGSVSLGVKFTADVAGSIMGIRFYKASTNTGTHVGSLWTAGGTLLAQGTFSNETASGWQSLTFATPVAITAGTTYVASYLAPNGHYSVQGGAFGITGVDNAPLHALANPISSNGVYAYGSTAVFPTSSYNSGNYFVDVLFGAGA